MYSYTFISKEIHMKIIFKRFNRLLTQYKGLLRWKVLLFIYFPRLLVFNFFFPEVGNELKSKWKTSGCSYHSIKTTGISSLRLFDIE